MASIKGDVEMSEVVQEKDVLEVLSEVFVDINKNKENQREIDELLSVRHKIARGTFNELLIYPDRLLSLNDLEKLSLILTIYKVTKDERINPKNFYATKEITKGEKYRAIKEEKLQLPITYSKVNSGSETDYSTKISFQDIAAHWNDLVWTYNYQTQRNPIKKAKKDGTVSFKPKLNRRSVNEIKKLMLDKKYLPDTITINVMRDGSDELLFNESDNELTIESANEINLIDGFHRVQAVIEALEENPDLDGYLYLSIRNYDLETARFYLGQHNSFNTFDKTHVRQLKSLNISDKIVEDINLKSDLRGRITTSTAVKKKFNEITNFAVLSDTIKDVFNPETGKDRLEYSYTLIRFFDYLVGSYPNDFVKNVELVSKTSWINHHNTFVGYVVMCHKLYRKYGKDFPLDEITRIMESINFSKNESEYNDILTTQGKVNAKQVKEKIKKFFEEKVDELLK